LEPLPDQQFPIIDKYLNSELSKNVLNMFDKADEFAKFGLPAKRAIILEGGPGNGKSMICRWLAKRLKQKGVTTFWVTAKSILGNSNVADIFDMARNLSPSLIIMEDMDLITGSRNNPFAREETGALGELLNQMDGLTKNENVVIVATTNKVNSLDEALSDRPGRFDRVYKVGLPQKDVAEQIAKSFLLASGLSDLAVSEMDFSPVTDGTLSGAQIIEIIKGGFFEAIHVGKDLDSLCIKRSAKGLEDQRRAMGKLSD
jgi:cell division protease FtsH